MNIKSTERNGNLTTIVVEIDKELMESGVNKAYLKARKSIQLPGWRKHLRRPCFLRRRHRGDLPRGLQGCCY